MDDTSGTGETLKICREYFEGCKETRFATLFIRPGTLLVPNYYVEETDKRIIFPWEWKEFNKE